MLQKKFYIKRITVLYLIFLIKVSNADFLQEISVDTSINYLYNSPQLRVYEGKQRHLDFEARLKKDNIDLKNDFYLIFRYRDLQMVSVWENVINQNRENIILKLWYINAIAQLGVDSLLYKIEKFRTSKNSIVREYAANAYAYLGAKGDIKKLEKWLKLEKNSYVVETIKNSISVIKNNGYRNRIDYIPRYYEGSLKKFEYFYNVFVTTNSDYYYSEDRPIDSLQYPMVTNAILPHQQYNWRIKNAPPAGYFGNNHGYTYHVGEDSGWLLDGLPVHAISNGVVRKIQHESSWGNLVVIESKLNDSSYICTIYGHLGENLDIKVGDTVYAGKKIGQIGNSFTLENGGYVGHVHIGIELRKYENAQLSGYSLNIDRFTSPKLFVKLIKKLNKRS